MKYTKVKLRFWMAVLTLLLLTWHVAHGQGGNRSWALKGGVGGIFTGHITGEAEVFLKGRVSIALRGALIRPNLDSLRGPAEGFFLKAGPKFYLSSDKAANLEGFALKPELVYGRRRDWETSIWGAYGNRWVNTFGLLCNLSYTLRIGDSFILEPSIGAGWVSGFETYLVQNDSPPYEVLKVSMQHIDRFDAVPFNHSHLSLYGDIALSGGLLVGVKF